jgi:hypothetical protein
MARHESCCIPDHCVLSQSAHDNTTSGSHGSDVTVWQRQITASNVSFYLLAFAHEILPLIHFAVVLLHTSDKVVVLRLHVSTPFRCISDAAAILFLDGFHPLS